MSEDIKPAENPASRSSVCYPRECGFRWEIVNTTKQEGRSGHHIGYYSWYWQAWLSCLFGSNDCEIRKVG